MRIRVLIVAASAVVRRELEEQLEAHPEFVVVGASPGVEPALQRARVSDPDFVLVGPLDSASPTAVDDALGRIRQASGIRALSFVAATTVTVTALIDKMQEAAKRRRKPKAEPAPPRRAVEPGADGVPAGEDAFGGRLIAIGASAGGTDALAQILPALQPPLPPIVVVVHMPEAFTARFAERLNGLCTVEVQEAVDGERLRDSTVTIARGDWHCQVWRQPLMTQYKSVLTQEPPVRRHRPSVDVLFDSVADAVGASGLGIILTGMGADGAEGLLRMRQAGATTVAQDEATSVVYGMPRAAVERAAAQEIVGLDEVAPRIMEWAANERVC